MKVPSPLSSLTPCHRNPQRLERAFRFTLFRKWDNLHVSCVCQQLLSTFVLILPDNLSLNTHFFIEYAYRSFGKSVEYTWYLYLELYKWKQNLLPLLSMHPQNTWWLYKTKWFMRNHQSTHAACWHCSQHIVPCEGFAKHNLEKGSVLC